MHIHTYITCLHIYIHRSDCEHFGLPPPELPLLEELQKDLTQYEGMWSLYGEFSSGMDRLCKEDWISFRYGTRKAYSGSFLPHCKLSFIGRLSFF